MESPAARDVRIVSLSPAISRALVDLGLDSLVVGRTKYCESLVVESPVVGDHFDLDVEALIRVEPTHVLLQPPRGVVPQGLEDLAARHGWKIGHWRIDTLRDIRSLAREIPKTVLGPDDPRLAAAQARANAIDEAIDAIARREVASDWTGRVLLVHSVGGTVGVYGTGTYLDEVLHHCGCENAAAAVRGWGQLTLEDIVRLNPQAVILIRPGGDSSLTPADAGGTIASLEIDAVRDARLALLRHADALLPSTSVVEVAAEMQRIIAEFADAEP